MFQLRAALRSLLRQPSFLATAVGALTLGIAAPTALFAVVQAALLRPLPYANAGDIYTVRTTMTDGRFTIGLVASEELASLRRATDLVTNAALVFRVDDSLRAEGGEARQIVTISVSEGFFELFGVPMAMGRSFTIEDHKSRPVRSAVLSSRAWKGLFSADPTIIGTTIRLATGPCLIVGVAPGAFDAPHDTDLWLAGEWQENIGHLFDAYVRLKPSTTPAAVQASLGPMWEALAKKYPDQAKNRIFVFRPLLSSIVGDLGPIALIAFGATALLLLLAMANVANLLLARGAARARELAVRVAIGASRWQLIRQLLAESMVIAVGAAAIGIPLAYAAVRAIVVIGGDALPRADGLRFDPMVALFAAGVMTIAGIAVGLLPSLTTADVRLMSVANEGGRGGMLSGRTRRLLGALVVCEITLAIALVAGAGRLLLSARNLLAVDPGFNPEGRLIVDALLPGYPYGAEPARANAWSSEVIRRLRQLGATQVGMATSLPLRRERDSTTFTDIVGRPVEPQFRPNGRLRIVSPELFEALGMRVRLGRGFSVDDRADGEPVVMVNEAWVTKFLPAGTDPLRERLAGLFFRRVGDKVEARPAAIIGVAADVRYSALDRNPEPVVYLVDAQRPPMRRSYVVTSTDGHPERLIPEIRAALRQLDPQVPLQFETMANVVKASLVWSRLGVLLMGTFGAVALVLAGTGVFGVLAFAGAQRHGEMAVRLSLGATPGGVFRLMLAQGARFAVVGGVLGIGLAWWMGRLMSAYVYQVSAASGTVLGGSALVVLLVALLATLAPARRAASVEPSRALRA
jgi:predicted permease